jgi:hypothetical protein
LGVIESQQIASGPQHENKYEHDDDCESEHEHEHEHEHESCVAEAWSLKSKPFHQLSCSA